MSELLSPGIWQTICAAFGLTIVYVTLYWAA